MKKYLILLFLFFTFSTNAENAVCTPDVCPDSGTPATYELARMNPYIAGGNYTAAGCSTATDYLGDKTDYSASGSSTSNDTAYCISYQAVTASCASGTWGKPYVAHDGLSEDAIKMCVYTDSTKGTGAPNNETKIACSDEFTCNTDCPTPTCTSGANLGGTATKDAYYFLCMIGSPGAFDYHRATSGTGTLYYKAIAGWYATPPATLTTGSWQTAANRPRGAYVEIY